MNNTLLALISPPFLVKSMMLLVLASLASSCNLTEKFIESTEKTYDELGQIEQNVELDSATIHWRKVGNGETNLMLIQGFGPTPLVQWKKIVKEIHEDYTLYIPDLVYFGESTTQHRRYSPKFQAEQIYASLRKMDVEKLYVAGLSYGGLVAELFAHEHPEMTEGLILIDALSIFYDREYGDSIANSYGATSMREFLLPDNGQQMKKLFKASYYKPFWVPGIFLNEPVEYLYTDREKHRYNLIDFMYENKDEIRNWDISYDGPVQIIWGKNDIIIPLENAYKLNSYYPNSSLIIIPGAGHVPNFEKDEDLAQAIKKFIENDRSNGKEATRSWQDPKIIKASE